MNESDHQSAAFGSADRSPIAWTRIPASPAGASRARAHLSTWLQSHFDLGDRLSDVLLAVYEALANAVDAAATATNPTMDVNATYDQERGTLTVIVIDWGVWHSPASRSDTPSTIRRGRGIPLMRALADHAHVDVSGHGTTVALTWNDVAATNTSS